MIFAIYITFDTRNYTSSRQTSLGSLKGNTMSKDKIYAQMDAIAGKLQDLDFLPEWNAKQQALFDSLTAEFDELEAQLKEIA